MMKTSMYMVPTQPCYAWCYAHPSMGGPAQCTEPCIYPPPPLTTSGWLLPSSVSRLASMAVTSTTRFPPSHCSAAATPATFGSSSGSSVHARNTTSAADKPAKHREPQPDSRD